jgi:hypothetical protein
MVTFEDNGRGFDHSRIVTYMCAGWSDKQGIDSVELGCYGIGKFAVLIFGDRYSTLIIQPALFYVCTLRSYAVTE